jgi:[protein-PII] uridylyltransferase
VADLARTSGGQASPDGPYPAALRSLFLTSANAFDVLAARTAEADRILADAFERILSPAFPSGLALLAVGGFGRSELFPYSDIDLLLLVERPPSGTTLKNSISEFLREGWDSALRLSHSVHTVADCCELAEGNVELTISLLDARFLTGDRALYQKLTDRIPKFLGGRRAALVSHLGRLARERHSKFQNTIYHLEPNIKETPGGLRDYHLVHWLERLGAAPSGTKNELDEAWRFLAMARCWLHLQSGRDNNLLNFETQDELSALPFAPEHDPSALMRVYFRHARAVSRLAARTLEAAEGTPGNLLRQFRDWRSRLSNSDFTVAHERVLFRSPAMLESDPSVVLRLFAFLGRHGFRLAPDSERRLEAALPAIAGYFETPRPVWPQLAEIFEQPHAAMALRAMHDTGVLRAVLPEWNHIECLVVRDFYHRYTVDEHTLVTIDTLHRLPGEKEGLWKRYSELLEELGHTAVLSLALLMHDLGKGSGAEQASAGAAVAGPAMERLGVPPEIRAQVCDLIARHLDLSAVMTARDLDDPSTGRWIADRTGTIEQLKHLTLLTYADISAVNPTAMTPWRLEQLWRVYLLGVQELTRELDTDRIHQPAAAAPATAAFLEGLPTRYLRTHTAEQIEQHVRLAALAQMAGVAIDLSRREGAWYLTVLGNDRPGLFASIAGALAAFGMNIVKAEAFSNTAGVVVDTFAFADPMRTLELNPSEVERLRQTVSDVVMARVDAARLLRGRKLAALGRKTRLRPTVSFDGTTSAAATLIEIVAEDRPGLLYDLASAISAEGCNIEVVLIDTEAHKALDVFYVTAEGRKLEPARQHALHARLAAACDPR